MDEEKMIRFEGSTLFDFDNVPFIFDDREYVSWGVAELSYDGQAQNLISKDYFGFINCEVAGFVEIMVEDENGKYPDFITPEMLDCIANTLATTQAQKMMDACEDDAIKWTREDG